MILYPSTLKVFHSFLHFVAAENSSFYCSVISNLPFLSSCSYDFAFWCSAVLSFLQDSLLTSYSLLFSSAVFNLVSLFIQFISMTIFSLLEVLSFPYPHFLQYPFSLWFLFLFQKSLVIVNIFCGTLFPHVSMSSSSLEGL